MDDIFEYENTIEDKNDIEIRIGDCLDLINSTTDMYDAVITDPPYELSLHGKTWDHTGISFSSDLWFRLFSILKPGGFIGAFAAPRLYHHLAMAAETAGFDVYPFMTWKFDGGLPKPANVAELFDRDNVNDREIIGYRNGSGFTKANVDQGAQNRTTTKFPVYARHVSQEAQEWRGYFYGVGTLKPCMEAILIAQKPIQTRRAIDNIRQWRTGALNIGALKDRYGSWPTTMLTHKKARKADHQSSHPSVKPVPLMEDLCMLLCPTGGRIIDPFAGTGTTGVAARHMGFACTLIERDPKMEAVIRRRVQAAGKKAPQV
jgi:DNA modification methylase